VIATIEGGHAAAFDHGDISMRKYLLAWLLGLPADLLVLIYVFMHIF